MLQLKRNEPSKKRCWIELTNNRLDIGETSREWMYRHDIAVANRREGHKAKIDQVSRNGQIILKRRETIERPRLIKRDKTKERDENSPMQR